jgi:hypothetical protein
VDDLPGQPKGIFVSRAGFQQCAIDFARQHGILVYEFCEADEEPIAGVTTTGWARCTLVNMPLRAILRTAEETISENLFAMGFMIDVFTPDVSNIHVTLSPGWLQNEYSSIDATKITLGSPDAYLHEKFLYDKDGAVSGTLAVVIQKLAKAM